MVFETKDLINRVNRKQINIFVLPLTIFSTFVEEPTL